jgi:RNA polymerase sigma-70 factor (ECF subfamily)
VADGNAPLTSAASCPGADGPVPLRAKGGAAQPAGPGDFSAFFDTYRDPIHRFLWRLTRNAADADDLLQETFLTAWRKRAQFDGRGSAEGWLRKTAFRLYLNQRTKSVRRADLAESHAPAREGSVPPAERAVDDREATDFLLRRVAEAVDGLPDGPREAFVLFRYEGMSCAAIADATDTPMKTVETRLRRATELLAHQLARYRNDLPGGGAR